MSDDLRSVLDGLCMEYRGKASDIRAENRVTPESEKLLRVYQDMVDALKRLLCLIDKYDIFMAKPNARAEPPRHV